MLVQMQASNSALHMGRTLILILLVAFGATSLPHVSQAQIHRTLESLGPSDLMKSERQRKRANE